jgi:hypothetical protein
MPNFVVEWRCEDRVSPYPAPVFTALGMPTGELQQRPEAMVQCGGFLQVQAGSEAEAVERIRRNVQRTGRAKGLRVWVE